MKRGKIYDSEAAQNLSEKVFHLIEFDMYLLKDQKDAIVNWS